ncbi:hypothetical protein [Arthrobacter sp. RCC_34]|uniref:DUF7341 domain-containing protein n=1 Tax=Arthrobacter sp. RCC_34 TaxID=3239230 RepID=UPI003525EDE7
MTSLASNIHQLIRPHVIEDGLGGYTPNEPLLVQLQDALKPNNGGGATSAGGAKLPVNATALALQQDIAREATQANVTMTGYLINNTDQILHAWDTADLTLEWSTYLATLTTTWVNKIQKLISPAKPYHPSRPCPACGQRFYGEERNPCLSVHWIGTDGQVTHPEDWTMECESCGAEWTGDSLGAIATAMKSREGL